MNKKEMLNKLKEVLIKKKIDIRAAEEVIATYAEKYLHMSTKEDWVADEEVYFDDRD